MNKNVAYNNNRFKILSKHGFKDFIGVKKDNVNKNMLLIYIGKNSYIKTTEDHKIFVSENEYKESKDLNIGDSIYTNKGLMPIINIKKDINSVVYDILHVENDHCFYIQTEDGQILVHQCLYIDELGFLANAEEFYESVYPTISSSDTTKVIITSTPKGLNFFYKMWVEAERGRSEYVAYDVKWYEHPDRDQKWYDTQVKNMNAKSIDQEIHCVGGDTIITLNGKNISMRDAYMKYAAKNSLNNNIVYFNE